MIKIQNLTKKYGKKTVVNNISFEINKGEVVGFLGPNGAGKTTTMNMITGYISSDAGSVTVDGYDVLENPYEVKRRIGYLPELPPLYFDMTVNEYLSFVFDLKSAEKSGLKKDTHIKDVLRATHIDHVAPRLIKNLSKGYKQRVGIAQALIGNPDVLILDEPTVGLDPKQIIEIRNLIGELKEEHTIILSSHVLPEVSAICQRVIIINEGNIVAEDTPRNLSKMMVGSRYSIGVSGDMEKTEAVFKSLSCIEFFESEVISDDNALGYQLTLSGDTLKARSEITAALTNAGLSVVMLRPIELSLEEIFVKLTTDYEKEAHK